MLQSLWEEPGVRGHGSMSALDHREQHVTTKPGYGQEASLPAMARPSGRHIPLVLVLGLIPPGLGFASSSTVSRLTDLGTCCGLSEPQFPPLGHTGDRALLGSQGPGSWQTWVQILARSSERSL